MASHRLYPLLGIPYPILQGGMVWCSGWKLAHAVSSCGGLGVIGSGSMDVDTCKHHIIQLKQHLGSVPFGVNIPLLYAHAPSIVDLVIELQVPVVISSAGNPALYTARLISHGIKVLHVVSNTRFAQKAEDSGCCAVIAEGVEAGGHNGREHTSTLCLIPEVVKAVNIPVIAAGGIASGGAWAACMALGASGVQIGTLFAASAESSAHPMYKQSLIQSTLGDTLITGEASGHIRMLRNTFASKVSEMESRGVSAQQIKMYMGKGRARRGIFEGDTQEGALEMGQASSQVSSVRSVDSIVHQLLEEYHQAIQLLKNF